MQFESSGVTAAAQKYTSIFKTSFTIQQENTCQVKL